MNSLAKSFLRRKQLSSKTNVFRALHREELPDVDLAVEIYGSYFYALSYDGKVPLDILNQIKELYNCVGGIIRFPQKNPHNQGWAKEFTIVGQKPPAWLEVMENGLKFKVTLTEKPHTGLFLDQRDNRLWVRENSQNKIVANLFAYTCSFSVAAAHGGAKLIHSVDISKTALTWGKENFFINQLDPQAHFFYADDVRDWLKRRSKNISLGKEPPFDLIICDPPTIGQGTKGYRLFKVEREWAYLCKAISEIIAPTGCVLFANNIHKKSDQFFKNEIKKFFSVTPLPPPMDFVGKFHARYYLACHKIKK